MSGCILRDDTHKSIPCPDCHHFLLILSREYISFNYRNVIFACLLINHGRPPEIKRNNERKVETVMNGPDRYGGCTSWRHRRNVTLMQYLQWLFPWSRFSLIAKRVVSLTSSLNALPFNEYNINCICSNAVNCKPDSITTTHGSSKDLSLNILWFISFDLSISKAGGLRPKAAYSR